MHNPRGQHYVFVHQALPAMFFADPAKFVTTLAERGDEVLHTLWHRVGQQVREANQIPPAGLSAETRRLEDGTRLILITLPDPQGATEAYFVALAYRPPTQQKGLTRFITLEYSLNLEGSPGTMLCEWTADKRHGNLGQGPEPTLEAFFEVVGRLVGQ